MTGDSYIKIDDLKPGAAYQGQGRNFDIAIWTGGAFAGLRRKFGVSYIDYEFHWDSDDRYGTFKPDKELK